MGRSSWRTPGKFTLLDSACSENNLSQPGSTGDCRGGGLSKGWGQGQAFTCSLIVSSVEQGLQTLHLRAGSTELEWETGVGQQRVRRSYLREKNSKKEDKLKRVWDICLAACKHSRDPKKTLICLSNFLKKNGGENIFGFARIPGGFAVWQPSGLSFLFVNSTSIKLDRNRKC